MKQELVPPRRSDAIRILICAATDTWTRYGTVYLAKGIGNWAKQHRGNNGGSAARYEEREKKERGTKNQKKMV